MSKKHKKKDKKKDKKEREKEPKLVKVASNLWHDDDEDKGILDEFEKESSQASGLTPGQCVIARLDLEMDGPLEETLRHMVMAVNLSRLSELMGLPFRDDCDSGAFMRSISCEVPNRDVGPFLTKARRLQIHLCRCEVGSQKQVRRLRSLPASALAGIEIVLRAESNDERTSHV